jgi:glycerol uptake facilitator-like aquaporin
MAYLVIVGVTMGILLAYLATRRKSEFRKRLLKDFELHSKQGTLRPYAERLINRKEEWVKSISAIRKPFNKHINLAIETFSLLFAILALVNAVANFDGYFASAGQGFAVVIFLGMVVGYIPSEWFFSGRIEAEIDMVIREVEEALSFNRLDSYVTEARNRWI